MNEKRTGPFSLAAGILQQRALEGVGGCCSCLQVPAGFDVEPRVDGPFDGAVLRLESFDAVADQNQQVAVQRAPLIVCIYFMEKVEYNRRNRYIVYLTNLRRDQNGR